MSVDDFFQDSGHGDADESDDNDPAANPARDELTEYLALAQVKLPKRKKEDDPDPVLEWWRNASKDFPASSLSSATVERLFSAVGISFAKAQKSGKADTLESIAFARANL